MTGRSFRALPADQPLGFEIVSRSVLSDGFRPLERLEMRHDSLIGGEPLSVTRDVLRIGTAVVVLALDPTRDEFVVIRQFRVGAALSTPNAAPLELPAGHLDAGESAEEAARREFHEETGLRIEALAHAFTILPSPGMSDETVVVFLGLVSIPGELAPSGLAEENEEIMPIALPVERLLEAVDEGRIHNGFLFAALNWFARRGRAIAATLQDSMRTPA